MKQFGWYKNSLVRRCEVSIYDLREGQEHPTYLEKVQQYGVRAVERDRDQWDASPDWQGIAGLPPRFFLSKRQ